LTGLQNAGVVLMIIVAAEVRQMKLLKA